MRFLSRRSFLRSLGAAGAGVAGACAEQPGRATAERFPLSDHFDGERFFNAHDRSGKSFLDFLRWRTGRQPVPWPEHVENAKHPPPARAGRDAIAATFIGHATVLLQIGGVSILTDPVFSQRASPFSFAGPRRVRDPGQPLEALPGVDLLLVSHNHYDHLDLTSLRKVKARWDPPTVTGLGNAALLAEAGLRARELDWWQSVEVAGSRVTYVPAQHFSARGLFDRNRALWGGFVVEAGGRTVYFAGDGGYCPHFAEIGARFPACDLALLPVGAYEPRWFMRAAHMEPEEAVQAHLDLGAKRSVGMHFGTFSGLADEAMEAPVERLRTATTTLPADRPFDLIDFGETLTIHG